MITDEIVAVAEKAFLRPSGAQENVFGHSMRAALSAALPLIERAVREDEREACARRLDATVIQLERNARINLPPFASPDESLAYLNEQCAALVSQEAAAIRQRSGR